MEPRSRSNDDQTQYQAQYRNGPEAGHWLVHEHRYERMLAPFTRLVLGAAAVARTDRVLDVGCGTGSTTCTAARDADDGEALGVDISRPLLLRAEQRARQDGLTNVGIGQTPAPRRGPATSTRVMAAVQAALEAHLTCDGVRLESWAWLVTARNPR